MSRIVTSSRPPVDISLISITRLMVNRLKQFGDKTFIIEFNTERSFTFRQMRDDCLRMSKVWLDLGLTPDQRFGVCGDNSYEYMVCLLSGMMVGGIAIPMRASDTIDEMKRTVTERRVGRMAVSETRLRQIKETDHHFFDRISGIYFGNEKTGTFGSNFASYESLIEKIQPISEEQIYEPKDVKRDVCVILESSGTTGLPKGCMFSHYNLVSLLTIGSQPTMYNRTEEDVISGHAYTAHISGLNQLLMSIYNGSTLILHPKFEINSFCAAIEKHKITAMSGPASIWLTLLKSGTKYDISSLKKVICGGAPLPKGCAEQIVKKYPHFEDFRQGYGMTEMTILIAFEEYASKHYESVGPPTPGNSLKVIDVNNGQELANNQTGEICVTGPTLFIGYDNNPLATSEAIDSNNFLHTGDLGYYDSDNKFYIVDRIKLLLKCDGMQVSPTELESIFYTHSAVKEVAVVGKPDFVSGQLPTAFVVLHEQYKSSSDQLTDQLLQYVNSRITPLKRIRGGVRIVENIPKNNSGKMDRNKLMEHFK